MPKIEKAPAEPITLYYDTEDRKGVTEAVQPVVNFWAGDHHRVVVTDRQLAVDDEIEGGLFIYLVYSPMGDGVSYEFIEGWHAEDLQAARLFAAHLSGTLRGHNLLTITLP